MNRRNFLRNSISALAEFTILPGAGRIWHATRPVVVPDWLQTERFTRCEDEGYQQAMRVFYDLMRRCQEELGIIPGIADPAVYQQTAQEVATIQGYAHSRAKLQIWDWWAPIPGSGT